MMQRAGLIAGLCVSAMGFAAPQGADQPSVLVQTTPVEQGSLPRLIVAYGTVQANPTAHESVMAPVAAIVTHLYVRVGQAVAKSAPLAQLEPTPPTRAAYAAAVTAQRVANEDLIRTQQMLAESLATAQQLAAAQKVDADARASLAAMKAQGAAGPTTLRAPNASMVTAVTVSTGAIVPEGSPLLELAARHALVLVAGVVPEQAASLKRGDATTVTPVSGPGKFATQVVLRGSVVDPSSGLVPIDIALPDGALLPGETAQASITADEVHGFVVPHAAVLVHDNGETYVVQAVNGVAKTVPVHVLVSVGAKDALEGSLDPSAPLILSGNYQLQDGMKVRVASPPPRPGP